MHQGAANKDVVIFSIYFYKHLFYDLNAVLTHKYGKPSEVKEIFNSYSHPMMTKVKCIG